MADDAVNCCPRCIRPGRHEGSSDRGYVAGDQADGFLALTHPESRESRAQ